MKLVLIGEEATKRTDYFMQAAKDYQASVELIGWDRVEAVMNSRQYKGAVMKIDPPSYRIVSLPDMKQQIEEYGKRLELLGKLPVEFLNTPEAIRQVLDKRECKRRLFNAGIPVTEMVAEHVESVEELLTILKQKSIYSVFIKPVYFSGAAGVTAFRMQPHTGRMQVYTSCKLTEKGLVNTKKLYRMEDESDIRNYLEELLKLDVIVERWYPKESFQGKSYDLRVVYQYGHIAHIVVRQAKGPITNLHLNNQALGIEALQLSGGIMEELDKLCGNAVALFPGLSMAGIDILLEKNSKKPYIIEMNGQGDLIYRDIYGENRIYKEQVANLLCRKQV